LSTILSLNPNTEQFICRWKASGASERANYQLFLTELCELLGVEKPRPASAKIHEATYTFERPVEFDDGEGKKTTNLLTYINSIVLYLKQNKEQIKLLLPKLNC